MFSTGFSKINYSRYIYRTFCYPLVRIRVISQPNVNIINYNYVCQVLKKYNVHLKQYVQITRITRLFEKLPLF